MSNLDATNDVETAAEPIPAPGSYEAVSLRKYAWTTILSNRWTLLVLRLAIGGIFLYAGARKIADPQAFADSIATFQLLPPSAINLVALFLPPFEVLLGIMLVTGLKLRAASLGAFLLSIVFVVALGQGIARGLSIDCGCFGSGKPSALSAWYSFGRAALLGLASVWVLRLAARRSIAR